MMMLNRIIAEIKSAQKIAIFPHVSADGDAIGSCLALGLALDKLNKEAVVYTEEEIPLLLSFLPGMEMTKVFAHEIMEKAKAGYDLVIALDTGDIERLGNRREIFIGNSNTVNVDHHPTNTMFASLNYVQTGAAATGEIIYQMVKLMGLDLDAEISTCLYVALTTDTGGFRYSNTTGITHQIAADLINNGVKVADISQQIFENTSLERLKLMGLVINSLELYEESKISYIGITEEMLNSAGAGDEDCDGMVNLGRSIRGVEVSVVLREKLQGEIRVNLRSKTYVDVAAIATRFGGGGHKRAAGCTIKGDMKQAKEMVLTEIRKAIKN